jgi:hypothetical protein
MAPLPVSIQHEKAMAFQFLVGGLVSVINIMIHALVTVGAVGITRSAGLRHTKRPRLHLMAVMVGTSAALMVAHTLEVFVWALAYAIVGAAPAGSSYRSALPRSMLQIEASELLAVQKYDLALIAANESDDVEFMQP